MRQVRVTVVKESAVTVTVEPEQGDAGPGPLVLHWGVGAKAPHDWKRPDEAVLKRAAAAGAGESALVGDAAQTALRAGAGGAQSLELEFEAGRAPQGMTFVLKDTATAAW